MTSAPRPPSHRPSGPGALQIAFRIGAIALALGAWGCATTGKTTGKPPGGTADRTRGTIRGVLSLPGAAKPARGKAAGRAAVDTASLKQAVAFVVDDLESPMEGPPVPERMTHTAGGFRPRVVVVPAGSTVQFDNRDSIYHSVFSLAAARRFDTGLFAPGKSRPVRFDRPGVIDVYCQIHARTVGYVVVVPNRHFARPDARGEFRLPPLKQGTYTVKAWHPQYGETRRRIVVGKDGNALVSLAF